MIVMYTLYYPAEMQEKLMAASASLGKPPAYVKKWLGFGATNGRKGLKMINIVYVEKGHADEASVEVTKLFVPILKLGKIELKTEVLASMSDVLAIYKK